MIKKFFTVMLGSLAAIWISVFIGILFLAVAIGSAVGSMLGTSAISGSVEDKSILHINLSGEIVERVQAVNLMDELMDSELSTGALNEYLTAIRRSAHDEKIVGILLDCGGSSLGAASRQELIGALNDFSRSGKWIMAYGDTYTQGDYYVACAADKMYVNPYGSVDIHGLASSIPFFKNLLDKIGVEMQVVKVGKFKSAVEPFILTEASEASIMQTRTYIDGIWNEISSYIADRRSTSQDSVTGWASAMCLTFTRERLESEGVADLFAYRSDFDKMLKNRCGLKESENLRLISPADYVAFTAGKHAADKRHIAVLYAFGDIVENGTKGIVGADMVPEIDALADNEDVGALVLRVNSGGGSAFASEQIWKALERFKEKGKPFYVSMGDYAASGGYYISCGADRIFADPATLTGSIGIFGLIPSFKGLVTDKLGINFSTVTSNPNADFIDVFKPLTSEQHNAMQTMVESGYETFVSRVASGRGMEVDSVKAIAEGRVWYGRDALRIGLVDTLGTLDDAVRAIAEKSGISPENIVEYPDIVDSQMVSLIRRIKADASVTSGMMSLLGIDGAMTSPRLQYLVERAAEIIGQISASPMQARMEDIELN